MADSKTKKGKNGKPKGKTSAYAYFQAACREEHKRQHPDEKLVFGEFSKLCGQKWKELDANQKGPFEELAAKDKKRWAREMENYDDSNEKENKKATKKGEKKEKDPNAPKRALSSYFLFCQDERPKVKAELPDGKVTDLSKILGERWKNLPASTKSKYEALYAREKARYHSEMEDYKAGNFVSKDQKAKNKGLSSAKSTPSKSKGTPSKSKGTPSKSKAKNPKKKPEPEPEPESEEEDDEEDEESDKESDKESDEESSDED